MIETFKANVVLISKGEWNSASIQRVIVEDFAKKNKTEIDDHEYLPAGWRARNRELTWIEWSEQTKNERKQEEEEKPARLSSQQEGISHKPNHKGYKAPEKKYQQEIKNRYP